MTEFEINDFISYFHIEKDNRTEINFESLQRNVKWLSEIKEDDKASLQKMKEILEDIQYN